MLKAMTSLKLALSLTFLFLASKAKMTEENSVRQDDRFLLANIGGNVSLRCFCKLDLAIMFYWYKQSLGEKPHLISSYYKHAEKVTFFNEFKGNKRVTAELKDNTYTLTISELDLSDAATYYCAGYLTHAFEFAEGTTLSVQGSGLDVPALVHQPPSETIQPGASVTLSCTVQTGTCEETHTVYWFKNAEDHQPKILYVHGGWNNPCETSPGIKSQTCIYSFPMRSVNASDAGTYYCAVLACGYIVFGNGTNLDCERDEVHPGLLSFLGGALAFTTILVIILGFLMFKMNQRNCRRHAESQARSSTPPLTTNPEDDQDAGDLHYAAFMKHKGNRSKRQTDDDVCVYSSVRR